MPASQLQIQQLLGFDPKSAAPAVLQLNAAANWFAASFIAQSNSALSKARLFVSALAGTLGANDLTLDLYSDAAGAPSASLESRNTLTSSVAAGAWAEWTGFTTTLATGTQYWLVARNVNGTPASNNVTIRYGATGSADNVVGGSGNRFGYRAATSTNSGGSWTYVPNSCGWRVQLASGAYLGLPVQNIAVSVDLVYLTRESGVQFVTPANVSLNLAGLALYPAGLSGAPSGNVRFGLWTGAGGSPTNVDYTNTIPAATVAQSTNTWLYGYFVNGTHAVPPGTTVRVTMADSPVNTDSSSNAYKMNEYTIDSDANSLALLPWSLQKTYFNGSTWAQTSAVLFPFALLLDTNGEFSSSGTNIVGTPRKIVIPPTVLPIRRPALVIPSAPSPLPLPARRIVYPVRAPATRNRAAAIVAATPVVNVIRAPTRQIVRTQVIRRNAAAALFANAPAVLVKSIRAVR
jgi:hypothetical protein